MELSDALTKPPVDITLNNQDHKSNQDYKPPYECVNLKTGYNTNMKELQKNQDANTEIQDNNVHQTNQTNHQILISNSPDQDQISENDSIKENEGIPPPPQNNQHSKNFLAEINIRPHKSIQREGVQSYDRKVTVENLHSDELLLLRFNSEKLFLYQKKKELLEGNVNVGSKAIQIAMKFKDNPPDSKVYQFRIKLELMKDKDNILQILKHESQGKITFYHCFNGNYNPINESYEICSPFKTIQKQTYGYAYLLLDKFKDSLQQIKFQSINWKQIYDVTKVIQQCLSKFNKYFNQLQLSQQIKQKIIIQSLQQISRNLTIVNQQMLKRRQHYLTLSAKDKKDTGQHQIHQNQFQVYQKEFQQIKKQINKEVTLRKSHITQQEKNKKRQMRIVWFENQLENQLKRRQLEGFSMSDKLNILIKWLEKFGSLENLEMLKNQEDSEMLEGLKKLKSTGMILERFESLRRWLNRSESDNSEILERLEMWLEIKMKLCLKKQ